MKQVSKSRRLNVLMVAYCVDKDDVGGAKMAYEWITHLAEYVDICVITTGSRFRATTGLEEYDNVKQIILNPRFSFKRWDSFDRIIQPGYVEFYFRAYKVAQECVRKDNFDLCHQILPRSTRYPSPFIGVDVPMVVGPFHGGLKIPRRIMRDLKYKEKGFLKLRFLDGFRMHFDPILNKHYQKAKRLVISAPYVQDCLLPAYRKKCVVILPPPDTTIRPSKLETSKPTGDTGPIRLVYVGRIVPSKGLEILIHAMAKLQHKNAKLTVYGKGPREKNYKRLAERLHITGKINWAGFARHSEIVNVYAVSDLFIFPSLKEPTGIALTEAMAAGLPVICVDAGGPGYIVDETCGIKVPITTKEQMVDELAKAMDTLCGDGKKRLEMGRNARKKIETEFTWDAVVEKMLKVYNEVVSENE